MVKIITIIMENPIEMDDLGGFPPIFGLTPISLRFFGPQPTGWTNTGYRGRSVTRRERPRLDPPGRGGQLPVAFQGKLLGVSA